MWGWAVVGMLVETYGFWLLFAGFFPTVLSFLRRIPVLGRALDLPMLKSVRRAFPSACAIHASSCNGACSSVVHMCRGVYLRVTTFLAGSLLARRAACASFLARQYPHRMTP